MYIDPQRSYLTGVVEPLITREEAFRGIRSPAQYGVAPTYFVDSSGRVQYGTNPYWYTTLSQSDPRKQYLLERERAREQEYQQYLAERAQKIRQAEQAEAAYARQRSLDVFNFPVLSPFDRQAIAQNVVLRGFTPTVGGAPRIAGYQVAQADAKTRQSAYSDYKRYLERRARETMFTENLPRAFERGVSEMTNIPNILQSTFGISQSPVRYA